MSSIFCTHKWKKLSETTTQSQLEHMRSLGFTSVEGIRMCALDRKHIVVLACDKCGATKHFVTTI